jgi:hypothetical protein
MVVSAAGVLVLGHKARTYTLQSLCQSDHSAVEIPIQLIWFDLDKATELEWSQSEFPAYIWLCNFFQGAYFLHGRDGRYGLFCFGVVQASRELCPDRRPSAKAQFEYQTRKYTYASK